jgi:hypothetical protein
MRPKSKPGFERSEEIFATHIWLQVVSVMLIMHIKNHELTYFFIVWIGIYMHKTEAKPVHYFYMFFEVK